MKTSHDDRALLRTLASEGKEESQDDEAMADVWQLILDVLDDLDGALSRLIIITGLK